MTDATWDGFVDGHFDVIAGNGPSGPGTNWNPGVLPNGAAIFPSVNVSNTFLSWQDPGLHPIQTIQFVGGLLYTFGLASGDMLSVTGQGLVNASGQTFNVGLTSRMTFSNSATADSATINADFGGSVFFNDNSSAGSSKLTINAGAATVGQLSFSGTSSAGSATIAVVADRAQVHFTANSTSAASHITIDNKGLVDFHDQTLGGGGIITINSGFLSFLDSSGAGGMLISDNDSCTFLNSSHGDNAQINIKSGGTLSFLANSFADNAQIVLQNGGTLDISGHSGDMICAPIAGTGGNIVLGANHLIIDGSRGGASSYGGMISGNGGLTFGGPGTFVLNGNNSFTGPTTLFGGTLELGPNGSIVGNFVFQNSPGTTGHQFVGDEQSAVGEIVSSTGADTSSATLRLDAPNQVLGAIVGFGAGDAIDFAFHNFASGDHSVWTPNPTNTGGTLSLVNVAGTVITAVRLTGTYTAADFSAAVDGSGHTALGSTAFLPTTVQQEILGLYAALYNRATDVGGVSFWAGVAGGQPDGVGGTASNAGSTAITLNDATVLGQLFVNTQSTFFNATYGSLSDSAFITALFVNLGGNATNIDAGVNFWTNALQQAEAAGQIAQASRAGVVGQIVHDMIDFDVSVMLSGYTIAQWQAVVQRQDTINNKVAVSLALSNASQQSGGDILVAHAVGDAAFQAATRVLQHITFDPTTVSVAITGINNAVAHHDLSLIT